MALRFGALLLACNKHWRQVAQVIDARTFFLELHPLASGERALARSSDLRRWCRASVFNVRYGSEADIGRVAASVRFGPGADINRVATHVSFFAEELTSTPLAWHVRSLPAAGFVAGEGPAR